MYNMFVCKCIGIVLRRSQTLGEQLPYCRARQRLIVHWSDHWCNRLSGGSDGLNDPPYPPANCSINQRRMSIMYAHLCCDSYCDSTCSSACSCSGINCGQWWQYLVVDDGGAVGDMMACVEMRWGMRWMWPAALLQFYGFLFAQININYLVLKRLYSKITANNLM